MRKITAFLLFAAFLVGSAGLAEAQIQNPLKKVKKKAEQETNKKIDESIEKAFDPQKEEEKKEDKDKEPAINEQQGQKTEATADEKADTAPQSRPELTWSKYDFLPGEEVFFEDNQEGREKGEFPSRWDIYSGNVENARLGDDNVIMFREDSWIVPFLENSSQPYLPDVFTLEFDCYYHLDENFQSYTVSFYDKVNQKRVDIADLSVFWNRATQSRFEGWYPGISTSGNSKMEGWRHVSISFNKRALKVYLDDTRLLNIPNLQVKPVGISIHGPFNQYKGKHGYIKNIRLAKGGVKLYDRMLQDGKIIATGIRFDVGKASLRPESMGIINTIAEMMQEHPELKFSIE